jgi:hypothetical protein
VLRAAETHVIGWRWAEGVELCGEAALCLAADPSTQTDWPLDRLTGCHSGDDKPLLAQQKPMIAGGVEVKSHDIAPRIDPRR